MESIVAIAALATIRNANSAPMGAYSSPELNLTVVVPGAPTIKLISLDIAFDHQLTVRHAGAPSLTTPEPDRHHISRRKKRYASS